MEDPADAAVAPEAAPGEPGPERQQQLGGGRPPLPPRLGGARTSSLASSLSASPSRSTASGQPSMQALSSIKLAQYRAGARTFKEDREPRAGLASGDVVAFQSQDGFYSVLGLEADSEAAVHYGFSCSPGAAAGDACTHLEVVKQGKWLAFRSAAAGDRFLQARKRSPRLVFFNTNIGTWEQWELAGEGEEGGAAEDEAPWAVKAVTLKHRRLPQFELRMELVRVGTTTLAGPTARITPSSLITAQQDADVSENVQLRKMSGVLMHEWFNFVDREKQLRMHIGAQVVQLVEDAADLKAWTVSQVDTIRGEMDEEVTRLLDTIRRKSAKLADTEARLTNRLRWGVAVLQAKNELGIKREVFRWWRGIASRKRYCRHVIARLQQRADLRHANRALQAWLEHYQEQQARQQRLWQAVRRMAFIRMYHTFASWREMAAAKREAALQRQHQAVSAWSHMQSWRLQRAFAAWRDRAARCCQGRALMGRMASATQRAAVQAAFTAWRQFLPQQRLRLESLTALVAARRRADLLQQVLSAWRGAVDEQHGRRLQLAHAQLLLGRLRLRQALRAWRAWTEHRAERQRAWVQLLDRLRLRRLQRALVAWQEEVAYRRERQVVLMRFVQDRAVAMMQLAFQAWREQADRKREHALILQQSVVRLSLRLLTAGWAAWRQHVAEARVQRHRLAVCQQRREAAALRAALAGWRQWVDGKRAERQLVQQGCRRSDRNRLAVAFRALQTNVEAAHTQRAQQVAAVENYARLLQSKALAAWVEAVQARQDFEHRLQAVGAAVQAHALRHALQGWRAVAQASIAQEQQVAHARHVLSKLRLRAVLQSWQGHCAYRRHLQCQLQTLVERRAEWLSSAALRAWREHVAQRRAAVMRMWECTMRISQLRMGWAFRVWREAAAERAAARRALQGAQRRIQRLQAAGAFRAWREHANATAKARHAAEQLAAARAGALLQGYFAGWADFAARRGNQKAAVVELVHRRAMWLMGNVLNSWRSYTEHAAQRRRQLQRAVRRLTRLRLQQAFAAWREHAEERRAAALALQAARRKLQAKQQARAFRAWAEHAAAMHRVRQAATVLASRAQQGLLAAAWAQWQEVVATRRQARVLLGKLARRTDAQLLASALRGWRQQVHRGRRLQRLETSLGARRQQAALASAFKAWRQHTADLRAVRAAISDRHGAEAGVTQRLALRAWRGHTAQRRAHRAHVLEVCVTKQVAGLQGNAFAAWRHYTQARQRAQAVMYRAVDRLATRTTRAAFTAWLGHVRARRARKTAIARYLQRWQQARLQTAFWQWRAALEERKAAADNLRRCLTRKRIAFKLFRNWYWESFDDEMQETLRTMFDITNEAAADPLPSRAASPINSLLSSPIRAQLGYGAAQQQQLAAGVAQRLAQPGSMQPAYLRFAGQGLPHAPEGQLPEGAGAGISASLHLGFGAAGGLLRQALPPPPPPLRSRVVSAVSSPVRQPHPGTAPVPNVGATVLAPFVDYACTQLAPDAVSAGAQQAQQAASSGSAAVSLGRLQQPPGFSPSPSPREGGGSAGCGGGGSSLASGSHSKAASTIAPRSPLTPLSAGYVGGTPMTHFGTPNPDGMFTIDRVPGTTPASHIRPAAGQQPRHSSHSMEPAALGQQASPRILPALQLPSPAHSLGSHAGLSPLGRQLLEQQQGRSPGSLSDAATPGSEAWGPAEGQSGTPLSQARAPGGWHTGAAEASPGGAATPHHGLWGAAATMGQASSTPLSQAHTPGLPGSAAGHLAGSQLLDATTPHPGSAGYALSPSVAQRLAAATTPVPPAAASMGLAGYQSGIKLKRMSESGSAATSGAVTQFHTPQASYHQTPSFPDFPELQGDYSIRRLSAAAEQEALEAQAQATPDPDGFIAAFPGTARRSGLFSSEEDLNAAKTPLYINPMMFDSPAKQLGQAE